MLRVPRFLKAIVSFMAFLLEKNKGGRQITQDAGVYG